MLRRLNWNWSDAGDGSVMVQISKELLNKAVAHVSLFNLSLLFLTLIWKKCVFFVVVVVIKRKSWLIQEKMMFKPAAVSELHSVTSADTICSVEVQPGLLDSDKHLETFQHVDRSSVMWPECSSDRSARCLIDHHFRPVLHLRTFYRTIFKSPGTFPSEEPFPG